MAKLSNRRKAARSYQVIDPCTLGRPVHLLGKYTERLQKDLSELLHVQFNRRYRAQFEIGAIAAESPPPSLSRRWWTFRSDVGRMAFAVDRKMLLCVLAYRYGVSPAEMKASSESSDYETATEERLAARLGCQLVAVAAGAIEALHPNDDQGAHRSPEFAPVAVPLRDSAWTLRVKVHERAYGVDGSFWFRLEEPWFERLMRGLTPLRERNAQGVGGTAAQPLPARLQLSLTARLVDKPISLGTLLDLRVGDVIPVNIASADVLVDDVRLFTASIAEHKGKLCLTCFQDVE